MKETERERFMNEIISLKIEIADLKGVKPIGCLTNYEKMLKLDELIFKYYEINVKSKSRTVSRFKVIFYKMMTDEGINKRTVLDFLGMDRCMRYHYEVVYEDNLRYTDFKKQVKVLNKAFYN